MDLAGRLPGLGADIRRFTPGSDIGLALGVVLLLSVMVVPLPTMLLDAGLAISITLSVLMLMVALFLNRPLDFTSFPTLLLLTTLLRLSLNVATTRLILAHGAEIGPEAVELAAPDGAVARAPMAGPGGVASLVGRRMEEVERDLIIETLGHTLGNRTHAATILGISIRALRNKLRDYAGPGVPVPPPATGLSTTPSDLAA